MNFSIQNDHVRRAWQRIAIFKSALYSPDHHHGAEEHAAQTDIDPKEYLRNLMLHRGLSKKVAVAVAAKELGLPKKDVYKESLKI